MHYPFGLSKLKKNLCNIKDALKEISRLYNKQFNENVLLNRSFMNLSIRGVLGYKEFAFHRYHNDISCFNHVNFKELLKRLIVSHLDIQEHYLKNVIHIC